MVKAYVEGLYVGLLLAAEASRRQAMSQHIGHGTALCCRAVDILVVAGVGKLLDVHAEKEARLVRCGEPACGSASGERRCALPKAALARLRGRGAVPSPKQRSHQLLHTATERSCRRKHRSNKLSQKTPVNRCKKHRATVAKNTGWRSLTQKTPVTAWKNTIQHNCLEIL